MEDKKKVSRARKGERNLRIKLNSPKEISSVLQGIIQGKKVIDLCELGIKDPNEEHDDEDEVDMTALPRVAMPGTSRMTEAQAKDHVEEVEDNPAETNKEEIVVGNVTPLVDNKSDN